MLRVIFVATIVFSAPVGAQSFQSMELATNLGTVLGSEGGCNLSFSQAAIDAWIDNNVDASDMGFPGTLSMMVQGIEFQMQSMSGSALTAHCRAVERTARHYSFVE